MALRTASLLLVSALVVLVNADIYLQNMRGSNNRVNGQGRNRQNANRLFDSQNNARGGYNAGGLKYIVGSELTIEWTNQHSCGGPNNNCELVMQYMCDDNMRNGQVENTIPFPKKGCFRSDCDKDHKFGMHENYKYYEHCFTRKRNMGLYTADQNMGWRTTARFTRQDNGGTRYGYECPEERDYYPYWHPSPWKDIAVLTNDVSRCDYYKAESQNVKEKWTCVLPALNTLSRNKLNKLDNYFRRNPIPQTEAECKLYKITIDDEGKKKTLTGSWIRTAAHGIPPPECLKSPKSRDNHNGNGLGGFANTYNWTIPNDVNGKCAFRIRYNISTGEFPFETDSSSNGVNKNNQPCKACAVNLGDQLGVDEWDAQDRGFILTGNPDILPMSIDGDIQEKFELKLAIDTSQFGRTFEDRSHVFAIVPRPANVPASAKIYNLNARGKRGNIVQTYPATEYDFVPVRLEVNKGDYIDIQWTGSDTNPGNNAGQGRAKTDRHNMLQMTDAQYKRVKEANADKGVKHGHWGNSYPANLLNTNFLGLSYLDRQSLAYAGIHTTGELDELDDAQVSFGLGVRQCNAVGVFRYLCTRNNNFTNRGQKGVIKVVNKGANGKKDSPQSSVDEKNDVEAELENLNNFEAEMRRDMMSS